MFPRGTIYPKTTPLWAPFKIKFLYALLRSFGAFLIFACLIYAFYCLGPVAKEEIVYSANEAIAQINPDPTPPPTPNVDVNIIQTQAEAKNLGLNSDFSIYIPKINAKASVIANIDPNNYDQYMAALKEGVAHTKGTNFPGEGKLIYLFSHSTNSPWYASRYGAVFYLLSKLETGDKITLFFADKKYEYWVDKTVIVKPSDISWLTDNGQGEQLILQTCTPAGTSLSRLLVIAKPVS